MKGWVQAPKGWTSLPVPFPPMGLMVALLPYGVDAEDIAHPDGLPIDELHVTSRYYGDVTPEFVAKLREAVMDISNDVAPFIADIAGHGTLGKDSPPATVLHLTSPDGEFEHIREALPEPPEDSNANTYPGYRPHLTLGYGVPEEHAENIDDTVGIKFDRIAVADNGDWFVASLTGHDRPDREAIAASMNLSDDRLGDLLVAYGSVVTDVLPDGTHLYDGPTVDDVGVGHPSEPIPELIREVLRLRDVAQHFGAGDDLVRRTVLGRCPACGADWRLTELLSEAPQGGGYRVRCHECDHEWDDPKASHAARETARLGADDPDPMPMMKGDAKYEDLNGWADDDMMMMPRVAGAKKGQNPFVLFKKSKAKVPSFTKKQRDAMAESGEAMSDGSFPIRDDHGEQDLANAVQSIGRAKDRTAAEAHIRKRAKALNLEDKLPPWIGKPARKAGLTPGWGYATDNDVHAHMRREARTAASRGRKNGRKKQRCLHGNPKTCRSIKWIRVYTALREERHFSKEKSARIANSMYNHWRSGVPRKGDKRPIVRKAYP